MSEILSQGEIDDLLAALNSGSIDANDVKKVDNRGEKQIKDYNFARPSKFSKEQLRTLEMLFENYVRLLVTNFTVLFRSPVSAEVLSVEAIAYQEFINSLPEPTILAIVDFYPLKGSVLLEISNNIGYSIIERLLGGEGKTVNSTREFSEIEIAIIERIMSRCSDLLVEPWESVVKLNPSIDKIETNPQYAQMISYNEMVALITIDLQIGEVQGMFNICVPYMVIEPIMDKLNTKFWFSNLQKTDENRYDEVIEKKIRVTDLNCSAVLGKTTISVGEFMNLQVGDVIQMNKHFNSAVDVYVDEQLKFKGKPGSINSLKAIQIQKVIREEDQDG